MRRILLWLAAAGTALGATAAHAQVIPANNGYVGTNLTVSTLTTGMVLDATSAISPDGRYITLKVKPQFSQLEGIDTFQVGPMQVNVPGTVGVPPAAGAGALAAAAARRAGAATPAGVQATPLGAVAYPPASLIDGFGPAANRGPLPVPASAAPNATREALTAQPRVNQDGVPYRPAQVGMVLFVETDKTLLPTMAAALRSDTLGLRRRSPRLRRKRTPTSCWAPRPYGRPRSTTARR